MSDITYFTKVQNDVEKWITDLGFKVKSEVDVENFRADLVINELGMIVEVDGPSHTSSIVNNPLRAEQKALFGNFYHLLTLTLSAISRLCLLLL